MKKNEEKLNLLQKLLEIQKQTDKMVKDAKGAFSYNYISGNAILSQIRPLMNKYGLLLKQEVVEIINEPVEYDTQYGVKKEMFTTAIQLFTWIDTESGEREEVRFSANGKNDWDKGLGSALTYAERYFLLKFFHIPTDEDDVDADKGQVNKNDNGASQAKNKKSNNLRPDGKEKDWLNPKDKAGNTTREWTNTLKGIREGKPISEVLKWYEVSNKTAEMLTEFKNKQNERNE